MWMTGPISCRLGSANIQRISDALKNLQPYVPSKFSRKPRSLTEMKRWKATEFRSFLLYTGPIVLLHILPDTSYKNFLLLFTGI